MGFNSGFKGLNVFQSKVSKRSVSFWILDQIFRKHVARLRFSSSHISATLK